MKRFFDKVKKTDTCWIWIGAKRRKGYGCINVNNKLVGAHRFSFEFHKHKITDNLFVCHTCDNPSCVNPDHLFLGTNRENILDAKAKGRLAVPSHSRSLHPSLSHYQGGCRCPECKHVHSVYFKNRYAKIKHGKANTHNSNATNEDFHIHG